MFSFKNAKPRALPPKEPFPILIKLELSETLSLNCANLNFCLLTFKFFSNKEI